MRKLIAVSFVLLCSALFSTPVFASTRAASPDPVNGYYDCMAYAESAYGVPAGSGNALTVLAAAERDGWTVSATPPQGTSIVVMQPGVDGAFSLGHVAVSYNGEIYSTWYTAMNDTVSDITGLIAWQGHSGSWYSFASFPGIAFVQRAGSGGAAAAAPAPTVQSGNSYSVQSGDTLSSIAFRFGTTWQALFAINKIANANLIYPGQVVFLGTRSSDARPSPSPSVSQTSSVMSPSEIKADAAAAGFPSTTLDTVARIAYAESSDRVSAYNAADPGGSYGLMQINAGSGGGPWDYSPMRCMQDAYRIYRNQGFGAWSTY